MLRALALAMLLSLSAPGAESQETPSYRLPGDPDTLVRRGPAVLPGPAPETAADPGNRAVRVEDLPPSPVRRAPQTPLVVTREVYLPRAYPVWPQPGWRLHIRKRGDGWSGDLVIGTPGGFYWPYPKIDRRRSDHLPWNGPSGD